MYEIFTLLMVSKYILTCIMLLNIRLFGSWVIFSLRSNDYFSYTADVTSMQTLMNNYK